MKKNDMKKITVIIPCHNEEVGVFKVISEMPFAEMEKQGFTIEVVVIDNNSTDKTAAIAKALGATVIHEPKKGKGNAVITGLKSITKETDYVVMLDGDNTYKSHEIFRLIEPLHSGFADVITGSRMGGKITHKAFKFQNRFVNWGFAFMVRTVYVANITDVLTGYYSWKREVVDQLLPHLVSNGFDIEMEMITKMRKLGFSIYSVPITYDLRDGESKIESLKDGIKIAHTFINNLFWKPEKTKK